MTGISVCTNLVTSRSTIPASVGTRAVTISINIPEYERISFVYISSLLYPVTEIKYAVRILSHMDSTLVRRPIYINMDDDIKRVPLNLTNIGAFNIGIRGFVKIPDRLAKDASVSV